jgi:hypothetical protein
MGTNTHVSGVGLVMRVPALPITAETPGRFGGSAMG